MPQQQQQPHKERPFRNQSCIDRYFRINSQRATVHPTPSIIIYVRVSSASIGSCDLQFSLKLIFIFQHLPRLFTGREGDTQATAFPAFMSSVYLNFSVFWSCRCGSQNFVFIIICIGSCQNETPFHIDSTQPYVNNFLGGNQASQGNI